MLRHTQESHENLPYTPSPPETSLKTNFFLTLGNPANTTRSHLCSPFLIPYFSSPDPLLFPKPPIREASSSQADRIFQIDHARVCEKANDNPTICRVEKGRFRRKAGSCSRNIPRVTPATVLSNDSRLARVRYRLGFAYRRGVQEI